jgi:hypothetical protein
MSAIGIIRVGDPTLTTEARLFDLPAEAEDAALNLSFIN